MPVIVGLRGIRREGALGRVEPGAEIDVRVSATMSVSTAGEAPAQEAATATVGSTAIATCARSR